MKLPEEPQPERLFTSFPSPARLLIMKRGFDAYIARMDAEAREAEQREFEERLRAGKEAG